MGEMGPSDRYISVKFNLELRGESSSKLSANRLTL